MENGARKPLNHITTATGMVKIWRIVIWGQPGQKVNELLSQRIRHEMLVPACSPTSSGGTGMRIVIWHQPGKKCKTLSKPNQWKKGWGHGPSDRKLLHNCEGFWLQYYQKTKTKTKTNNGIVGPTQHGL
jgi:hypothetical protein